MKRIFLFLLIGLIATPVFATDFNARVSGGTVHFTSDSPAQAGYAKIGSTGQTVTFNSIANHIYLRNESTVDDCYVNIRCRPDDSYAGSLDYYTVKVPAAGSVSPPTVELDFYTSGLSFWSNNGSGGDIVFIVTGNELDL